MPRGPKLMVSQYTEVIFTPDKEVDGVRVRPLPAMSQPGSQYATVKVYCVEFLYNYFDDQYDSIHSWYVFKREYSVCIVK